MTTVLHVFPDTNLFLQCKSLQEVDWTLLGDWQQIEVIVSAPVQEELDSLKAKGNTRQASRARSANGLLGRLLEEEAEVLTLKNKPLVRLSVRVDLRPDSEAVLQLPKSRDNDLVCTALGFQYANPEETVRLLTHDNGPKFSAKRVGLQFINMPMQWLLPPEPDESEKREVALKARISQLEKTEPFFETLLSGHDGKRLEASVLLYEALTAGQVDKLIARIVERYPIQTDFGPSETQERFVKNEQFTVALLGAMKEVFIPVKDEDIARYNEDYKVWKNKCKERLLAVDKILNSKIEWPLLTASIKNIGSRPAEDALVIIEVHGELLLMAPKKESTDEERITANEKQSLPRPPVAPKGTWRKVSAVRGLTGLHNHLVTALATPIPDLFQSPAFFQPESRDPNGFYWKEGRNGVPSKQLEFTCEQWRHAQAAEEFNQFILCPSKAGKYTGLMTISIHAANLSIPAVTTLPIQINREATSCLENAERMVDELLA